MNPSVQLYEEIRKIAVHPEWEPRDQVLGMLMLMERLFAEATRREQIAFSTLFAKVCYVGHKYSFQAETLQLVHVFLRAAKRVRQGRPANAATMRLGVKALAETVLVLYQTAIPPELLAYFPAAGEWEFKAPEIWDFKAVAKVVLLRDDPANRCFIAIDEDDPTRELRVLYDLPDRNSNFRPSILLIQKVFGFPLEVHLLETDIDRDRQYRPKAFIIEPDYLVDVSAISECFKDSGPEPLSYLVRKFLPHETTIPIHLGNVANFFLDRLLTEPDARFPDLFKETFQNTPFVYAPMSDAQVREVSQAAQQHFITLQNMANGGLAKENIDPRHCVLEPSFYSQEYGIQGRLDLFYKTETRAAIVELKSGKPFKPNSYGITRSHFTQTLLYDLLVRSVYGRQTDPAKYILYSVQPEKPLCFAPTIEAEQWEALQVRNQLVAIEKLLCTIRPGDEIVPVLTRLKPAVGGGKGFLERDFAIFEQQYARLDRADKKYFNAFVGFIAREQWLAKVGLDSLENVFGHANLWRSPLAEKQAAYSILSHLEIVDNRADQPDPQILFKKTEETNPLANFRVGDIVVLYPAIDEQDTVLMHQVIKCTITELGEQYVRVQLRYRQFNLQAFDTDAPWSIEPDMMETGFTAMYRGLFEMKRPLPQRLERPRAVAAEHPQVPLIAAAPGVSEEQAALLSRILRSKDFFLLWGPPGTGKTSVMIRELARWVLENSRDNLLLLAYTNRAVDEICEALDHIGGTVREQYIRIGSAYAASAQFRPQLLREKIAGAGSRAELRKLLEDHRIFVSTVASFASNESLLRIKTFQRLIIDEASQILEPQLIGLLGRFEHYVLIGDHRQLPAVTSQPPELSLVEDEDLLALGLRDLRESYFERLYRLCEAGGHSANYGRLSAQGRMNEAIMAFPNEWFYGGFLRTMPHPNAVPPQAAIRFIGVEGQKSNTTKTNAAEAELIATLVAQFRAQWQAEAWDWDAQKTLGIITPWRAQIAQIRASLVAAGLDPDEVTIDTVERYQGGARDIILISTCVNAPFQLNSLVSLSDEGVDRKLNVALTRARRYLYLVGNPVILAQDERYRAFIERYG